MKSDGDENKNWWSSVPGALTAFATLITAIGGFIVILNTNGCLKSDNNEQIAHKTGPDTLKPQTTIIKTEPVINYDSIAVAIASQWLNNIKNKNLDDMTAISSVPYYADHSVLTSLSEVRDLFGRLTSSDKTFPDLTDLKIYKASDLKNKGIDFSNDRFYQHLNLEADPYIALLGFNGEYTELVFRKSGKTLKIAGFWD
jgi:hypothetical protein